MGEDLIIPCVLEKYKPNYQTSRFFVKPSHKFHFPMFGSEYHANLNAFPRLKRLTNKKEGAENFEFDKGTCLGRRFFALVNEDNIVETDKKGVRVKRVENFALRKDDALMVSGTPIEETDYI